MKAAADAPLLSHPCFHALINELFLTISSLAGADRAALISNVELVQRQKPVYAGDPQAAQPHSDLGRGNREI